MSTLSERAEHAEVVVTADSDRRVVAVTTTTRDEFELVEYNFDEIPALLAGRNLPGSRVWGIPDESADRTLDSMQLRLNAAQAASQLLEALRQLPLVAPERLVEVSAELFDLIFCGHGVPQSSVGGTSEGTDAAGPQGPAAPFAGKRNRAQERADEIKADRARRTDGQVSR